MTPTWDMRASPPRRLTAALTILVAVVSAVWMSASFTYPVRALVYHWPIIILCCPVTLEIAWRFKRKDGRAWILLDLVALSLTAGRYFADWPFSGHALLGAFWALAPLPRVYRWLSLLMIPLSFATKVYLNERSTDALTGAVIGVILALFARWMARHTVIDSA